MMEAQTGVSGLADLVRASRLPSPTERRRVREVAGVSLRRMGHALGVTAPTVHNWENAQEGPSMENAAKYRRLLEELANATGTEIAEAPYFGAADARRDLPPTHSR